MFNSLKEKGGLPPTKDGILGLDIIIQLHRAQDASALNAQLKRNALLCEMTVLLNWLILPESNF